MSAPVQSTSLPPVCFQSREAVTEVSFAPPSQGVSQFASTATPSSMLFLRKLRLL